MKTGLHIAILGSDGAGKTTVLQQLTPLLCETFSSKVTFHFRPKTFQKSSQETVTNPHGQSPRSFLAGVIKLIYYFLDQWLGYFLTVRPALRQGALVIFDRNFDDMLVDQRRYRLNLPAGLIRFLSALVPKADLVFVLDAAPEVIHARKPELTLEELRRQRTVLKSLAAGNRRAMLVNAEEPPEKVAATVARAVIERVAARTGGRR